MVTWDNLRKEFDLSEEDKRIITFTSIRQHIKSVSSTWIYVTDSTN